MKPQEKLILLSILISITISNSCKIKTNVNSNANPNVVHECIINFVDNGSNHLCGKKLLDNTNLTIKYTIPNNSGKTKIWSYSGIQNPRTVIKASLIPRPGNIGVPNSSVLGSLPGNQKFFIEATAIGDCCSSCKQCPDGTGGFYYGRLLYSGITSGNEYFRPTNGNKYIVDVPMKVETNFSCEPDSDCR